MSFRSGSVSKWFIAFCVVFGVLIGLVTAAIAMSFWSMVAGEEPHRGLFILIWMMAAVVFFAWPMHIYERTRAVRRQRKIMRERIGDLDHEPSLLPIFAPRASGPKDPRDETDGLAIKAPDIEESKFRTLLSGGRTSDQRMADYLKTLELKAEMEKATESKADGQEGSENHQGGG